MDMFTSPYVFNPDEARTMTHAGADLLVCHLGPTTGGAGVASSLDDAIKRVMEMADAIWTIRKEALVIYHVGPFDEPDNVGKALKQMPGIAGFYGASSAERLPIERAITAQVAVFKGLELG